MGRGSSKAGRIEPSKSARDLNRSRDEYKAAAKRTYYVETKDARDGLNKASDNLRKAQTASNSPKGSKAQRITDFIYTQVNVDLSKHDAKATRKMGGGVVFDWKRMSRVEQQRVAQAVNASNSKYVMEDWSSYQKIIRERRADEPF